MILWSNPQPPELRAFWEAGILLPEEIAQQEARRRIVRERVDVVHHAFFGVLAALAILLPTAWFGYTLGLSHEGQRTDQAITLAQGYNAALSQCVEAADMSLAYIRDYDESLANEIARRRRLVPATWADR